METTGIDINNAFIRKWIRYRVGSCTHRKGSKKTCEYWRPLIEEAVKSSNGKCPYTGHALDFSLPATDPFYPSLDHVKGINSPEWRFLPKPATYS